jgi:hypothetical protein
LVGYVVSDIPPGIAAGAAAAGTAVGTAHIRFNLTSDRGGAIPNEVRWRPTRKPSP